VIKEICIVNLIVYTTRLQHEESEKKKENKDKEGIEVF